MEILTADTVQEAFLAAPPTISSQILDLTVKHPSFLRDVYELSEFPLGSGTVLEQLVFRGSKPPIERGFDQWKKMGNLSGCNPCDGPDCSYNWTTLGGHGFERKLVELMTRDFKSPDYCVNAIQTSAHFEEVFAKVVENLYGQIDFFKEINIGQNVLTMLAKKYIVDGEGAKPNRNNPYVYRNVGAARLGTLTMDLLEFFYEQMCRMPEAVPYDVIDGAPIFAAMGSRQMFARLFRDNTELRQDVRFSGLANDMLMKYNFMTTIRGMFIPAPILYPRRFKIVEGEPVEVLPFLNGVPAEVGSYTDINPDYENSSIATHEELLLHGKWPFKVFFLPTATTLGANTSFGPEQNFMNTWQWVNPQTRQDPARREGFFFTSAKIGISQQFSEAIFGILLERPSRRSMVGYTPVPAADPEAIVASENIVPDVGCPCPAVVSVTASPYASDRYTFVFATPQNIAESDEVELQLDNGLTITGTVAAVTEDTLTADLVITGGLGTICPANIVGVACESWTKCASEVLKASDCRSGVTGQVDLILKSGIKAAVGDNILGFFGDCSTGLLEVIAIDPATATYTVSYATGYGPTDDPTGEGETLLTADILCDRQGISKVCVPPETDETCPPCSVSLVACEPVGT